MKQTTRILALVLALMLALAGCGGSGASTSGDAAPADSGTEPASTEGGEAAAPAAESDKKTLVIGLSADVLSMDPQAHLDGNTSSVLNNMHAYLLRRDDEMNIYMDAVTEYAIVDDTTWGFTLREGMTFHNGDPVTAEDVKFSVERACKDDTLMEYPHWLNVDHVDVIDDTHFNIVTKAPYPALEALLSKSGGEILPKKYIEENGMEKFLTDPIGCGPYEFVSRVKDDRIVLKPYQGYHGEVNNDWEEVIFRVIPETSTRVSELLTGGVDIVNNIPPNEWERVGSADGVSVARGDGTRVYMLGVKHGEENETANPKVREAIDYAIDDKLISDQVLSGSGVPTRTRVCPGVVGHDESLYNTYLYDPQKAKDLLAEAGYPDGFTLKIQAPTGRYLMDTEVAQVVAAQLQEVGIKVELELLEFSTYSNLLSPRLFEDGFIVAFGDNFFDGIYPIACYTPDFSIGETDYVNDHVTDLYNKAMQNMNLEERIAQLKEVQQIAAEERPYICIAQIMNNYGTSDAVKFTPRLDDRFSCMTIRKA